MPNPLSVAYLIGNNRRGAVHSCTVPLRAFIPLMGSRLYPLYIRTLALGVTFFVPLRKMVK